MTDEQVVSKYLKSLPEDLAKSIDELSPMTASQRAALLTLVTDKKPRKILEAGILAGARTVELANCLKCNNSEAVLFSVDPTVKYYADANKKTGFLVQELFEKTDIDDNCVRLFIGNIINEVLPTIGSDIDLLILDSFGMAPGEIPNLVACLPYLSKDCTVVVPRTDPFVVIGGLMPAIESLGLSEQAVDELLEYNRFFNAQAVEIRRNKALITHKLKLRKDDLSFTKHKLDSAKKGLEFYKSQEKKAREGLDFYKAQAEKTQEGLDFYKAQAEKTQEGLDFYKAQAEKTQEGLDFYKELLAKRDEGLTFYRSQLESREERLKFYKNSSEAKNRELDRLRAQMDSQDEQLANIEKSLSWRIASKIGSVPTPRDK